MVFSARAIGILACVGWALFPPRQNPPSFKTAIQTVAVYATVRDRDGHLVTNLTKGDFEIFDNGRAVEIATFSNAVVPSTVALLLDMHWSTGVYTRRLGEEFTVVRDSAGQFVQALLPDDRLRIVTIGHASMRPYAACSESFKHLTQYTNSEE